MSSLELNLILRTDPIHQAKNYEDTNESDTISNRHINSFNTAQHMLTGILFHGFRHLRNAYMRLSRGKQCLISDLPDIGPGLVMVTGAGGLTASLCLLPDGDVRRYLSGLDPGLGLGFRSVKAIF